MNKSNCINLIITADDLGRNHECNLGILSSFQNKIITHTSLMVINKGTDEILNNNIDKNDIGFHMNLIESETPITYKKELNVNYKNNFAYYLNKKRSFFFLKRSERSFIRKELVAQIEKYISLGYKCVSFDSHGHTHTRLPVALVIIPILRKYNFKIVRVPFGLKKTHKLYKKIVEHLYKKYFKTVDLFIDSDDLLLLSDSSFVGKNIELMVHPYYENGTIINRREKLSLEEISSLIKEMNINLIHINDIL